MSFTTNPNQNAAQTYQRNAILTATPEKIIKLLYDGAIRHLEQGRAALDDPSSTHSAEVGISLGKAMSILGELRSALDFEQGGEIANNLDALYEYSIDQLTQANLTREATHLEPPIRVMRTLKEGWDAVLPN